MKTRTSLVSNSSSASFIIAYDPKSKKNESFTDEIVKIIVTDVVNIPDEIDQVLKDSCFEEDDVNKIKEFLCNNSNYKLAYWSGDYSCQGRNEIIENMFNDTKLIYTYCSDGESEFHI